MRTKNLCAAALLAIIISDTAAAATSSARATVEKLAGGCAMAETLDAQGEPVLLWQHRFEDGSYDLAMARARQGALGDIHRVTFGGGTAPACRYQGLAIARGGDWGWHLAWAQAEGEGEAGKPALRYARMDGAAWVSSPAKRFGGDSAHDPRLQVEGERVTLSWREMLDGKAIERSASSVDGGRSWE